MLKDKKFFNHINLFIKQKLNSMKLDKFYNQLKLRKLKLRYIFLLLYILIKSFFFIIKQKKLKENFFFDESTYFPIWETATQAFTSHEIDINNFSIRQIVRVSLAGEKVRLKISNKEGQNNLEIRKACIADLVAKSEVDLKTMKFLKFNGKYNVNINKGEEVYSDTISYSIKALSDIAISIYFGKVPQEISGHLLSRTYSYFEKGYKIRKRLFSNKKKISHWYFISALEISSNLTKKIIVCFGDSITDGASGTSDARNNYPDILSSELHKNEITSDISVLNKGIDGNRITTQGILRYEDDALNIKGVKYIVLLFGVNDINALNSTSSEIIPIYRTLIKKAHERNIFIYAGTILPFARYKTKRTKWNKEKEKERKDVNKWIRTTKPDKGGFDAFFDFDKLMKDPKDEKFLETIYDCGDGIHPSLKGYQKMVEIICSDLSLFTKIPKFKNY